MLVQKRDIFSGAILVSYPAIVATRTPTLVLLHATWQMPARDLGYTEFAPGDRFTEYFYADHWFNVMQIAAAATGALRGWYCNITRPATIMADIVIYDDLLLDLWVDAAGQQLVLDEAEFAAAPLDERDRAGARAGLAEVRQWARDGIGPFAPLAGKPPSA